MTSTNGFATDARIYAEQVLNGLVLSRYNLASYLDTVAEELDNIEEWVAEALYELAMKERRVWSRTPEKFSRKWRDEPYIPPLKDGESRPYNWRDGWREDARAALRGEYVPGWSPTQGG